MKCPRCQRENPSTAKFCQECAAPLARTCRRCGSLLPEAARFCPECAQPADGTASGGKAPPAETTRAQSVPSERGDRRQATVVFADISGYTQLCASMDAEHVQALLNRFYTAMDGTVAAYGGSVIDHAGDGLLAAFGAPVAYGNDLRYASALEEFVRPEPMVFAKLVVARARAMVALARRGPQPDVVADLVRLREDLRHAGFGGLAPGIDAALAAA